MCDKCKENTTSRFTTDKYKILYQD